MNKTNIPLILVGLLSLGLFLSRMMPHQPNLTPVLALCLFSGFLAKGRWYSMVLPLAALIASDWWIGFYPGWGFNYISLVLLLFSGVFMKKSLFSFAGFGFAGALLFFLVSNFGVWVFSQMYAPTFEGLINCYEMGLIFFRATLSGTMVYMLLFYAVVAVAKPAFLQDRTQRV